MRIFISHAKAGSYHGKGLKCWRRGKYTDALNHFKTALSYAEKCNNDAMVAGELEAIAQTYYILKDFDHAENYTNRSLEILEKIEHYGDVTKDRAQKVRILLDAINAEKI